MPADTNAGSWPILSMLFIPISKIMFLSSIKQLLSREAAIEPQRERKLLIGNSSEATHSCSFVLGMNIVHLLILFLVATCVRRLILFSYNLSNFNCAHSCIMSWVTFKL